MKHGRWIDPMKVLRKKSIKTSILKKFTRYEDVQKTKYKAVDMEELKKERAKLMSYIDSHTATKVWDDQETLTVHINDKEKYL